MAQGGLKVLSHSNLASSVQAPDSNRVYEDLNVLLQVYSPRYQEAFGNELMSKLTALQGGDRGRFAYSSDEDD